MENGREKRDFLNHCIDNVLNHHFCFISKHFYSNISPWVAKRNRGLVLRSKP